MGEPESITEDLRCDILDGRFPPGERLVELKLTEQYDCGRLAVRTALVELAHEGLVDREANRGATVRDISLKEAVQITEARAALESLIAAQAALHATDAQRAELQTIGDRMASAVAADDRETYSGLDAELHRLIRKASGHVVAAHLVGQLRNRGAQHRFKLASVPGRAAESLDQHRAIIAAIVNRDGHGAAAAMNVHLSSVIDRLHDWTDADDMATNRSG